jgi:hypothetical protein
MSRCRSDTYQAEIKTKYVACKDFGLLTIEDKLT